MKKNVDYYLSKGFDLKFAQYFASGRKKIVKVEPKDNYSLILTFDNNEIKIYDMSIHINENNVFAPLISRDIFNRVYLDKYGAISWDIDPDLDSEVVWQNKIDICPDSCYVDSVPIDR